MKFNKYFKSPVSLAIFIFVFITALIFSTGSLLSVNLISSVDALMEDAKTPHLLQMHKGIIDVQRLEDFAAKNSAVTDFQVMEYVNFQNSDIVVEGKSIDTGIQQNGVVKQGKFDFLLDRNNEVIEAEPGEIYVPINYMVEGKLNLGDTVSIAGEDFTVRDFVRDSQMNSALASSKRFLISHEDFEKIRDRGEMEYLIEFRVANEKDISEVQREYAALNLPSEGPTITYALFKLVNGFSDGLVIGMGLILGLLSLGLCFLTVKLTTLRKLEEDFRDIGILKAIGIRQRSIILKYLKENLSVVILAGTAGAVTSLLIKKSALESISIYMGINSGFVAEVTIVLLSALLIVASVSLYNYRVLRRIRNISPVEAINNHSIKFKKPQKYPRLSGNKILSAPDFLGIKSLQNNGDLFLNFVLLLTLATLAMNFPQNLYDTVSSPKFATYMGIVEADVVVDLKREGDLQEEMANYLANSKSVDKFEIFKTKKYVLRHEDVDVNVDVVVGDHSEMSVNYLRGQAPTKADEIAISSILAEDLGINPADAIHILKGDSYEELTCSGIYSDVTNGGKTAKVSFDDSKSSLSEEVWIKVHEGEDVHGFAEDLSAAFPTQDIKKSSEVLDDILGSTAKRIKTLSFTSLTVSLFIVFVISLLFFRLLVMKEKRDISILKALGFRFRDVKRKYYFQGMVVFALATIMGSALTVFVGPMAANLVFAHFGATNFKFENNLFLSGLVFPLLILSVILISVSLITRQSERMEIVENIKERL
ncbi:MAG: FtsX-like permease family protein [Peptoniphilus sp.]|nr:FtsX-like permease family protein [Peptoniphilus sp.]